MEPKYQDVDVLLTGQDGNVFLIIGRVSKALKRAGYAEAAKEFGAAAMNAPSYDAVLQLCMRIVNVQ
mgnify:FL=1